jgi:pantoate--beta-alanine ligase
MTTLRTVAEVRAALAGPRREGRCLGLVPTMGFLHEGHLALIRRAREECDVVVVSAFVNPTQFDDVRDLDAYPRDEARDAALAAQSGADILYAPPAGEVYPPGFATTVRVARITEPLEGATRGAGHFDGVATVVTKLFNVVAPDVAYFGEKDAQQLAVVRRLVRDLDIPVRIAAIPTVREPDGLALSSRNVRLEAADRRRALALKRALDAAHLAVEGGRRSAEDSLDAARAPLREAAVEPDYVALVDPDSFEPVAGVEGDALLAVAARLGDVRLIDNALLTATNGRRP